MLLQLWRQQEFRQPVQAHPAHQEGVDGVGPVLQRVVDLLEDADREERLRRGEGLVWVAGDEDLGFSRVVVSECSDVEAPNIIVNLV